MCWKGSELCSLCRANKDADHLLFKCPMAEFVRAFLSESLGWDAYLDHWIEFISEWLPGKFGVSHHLGLACFAWIVCAFGIRRTRCAYIEHFLGRQLTLSNEEIGERQDGGHGATGARASQGLQTAGYGGLWCGLYMTSDQSWRVE
jgi:hypothetical protein